MWELGSPTHFNKSSGWFGYSLECDNSSSGFWDHLRGGQPVAPIWQGWLGGTPHAKELSDRFWLSIQLGFIESLNWPNHWSLMGSPWPHPHNAYRHTGFPRSALYYGKHNHCELYCTCTASFSKELKVFCGGGGEETDRQIFTLAFQTYHARTSTCQTFILTTAHWGSHGSSCRGEGKPHQDGQWLAQSHITSAVQMGLGAGSSVSSPALCRTLPGLPADEARGEWADSFPFLFGIKIHYFPHCRQSFTHLFPFWLPWQSDSCLSTPVKGATWRWLCLDRHSSVNRACLGKVGTGLNYWTVPFFNFFLRSLGK
jgi:hypothetical protein